MARPVFEEPEVELFSWHFVQENGGYFRLVGYKSDDQIGRITSPLVEVDMHARSVVTASGRLYRLLGEPDPAAAARIVHAHLNRWGLAIEHMALAEADELVLLLHAPKGMGQ